MKIEYPSNERKERSIAYIMRQTARKKRPAAGYLLSAYREIGLPVIMRRSRAVFALSALIYVLLIFASLLYSGGEDKETVTQLFFTFSPFVLIVNGLLYILQERTAGVYEQQCVCKYTPFRLLLLRMPVFSALSMAVNFLLAFFWCFENGFGQMLELTGTIASSVMLCSLMQLAAEVKLRGVWRLSGSAAWLALSFMIFIAERYAGLRLLESVPVAVHIAAALIMVSVFVKTIQIAYARPVCMTAA